jgi:pimeloyl-ACP methyl ester carboxylesterase
MMSVEPRNKMLFTRRVVGLGGLLAAAACAHSDSAPEPRLEGTWRGAWIKGGDGINVVVRFEQTGLAYRGSFESDDLQVVGIPFARIEVDGPNVSFVLAGDETTTSFEGTIAGDRLRGALREGDVTGSFSLVREATPPAALAIRLITFENGDVTLSGEIIASGNTRTRHAAIVFLHGSGPEGRWASRYLAHQFARRGFDALIFDKRGVGESSGDWQTSSLDDLAADGAAAVRVLATLREVDPSSIGAYGHSQGAMIAPLLAYQADLKFVIGSAATGIAPAETELYSLANSIGVARMPPTEQADALAFLGEVVAVAYDGKPRDELDRLAGRFRGRSWFFDPPGEDASYWNFSRRLASYNPTEAWARVRSPTLLLWGARDERVPPARSAEAIAAAMARAGNTAVTTRIYENSDHAFWRVEPRAGAGWPRHTPGYVDAMISWALAAIG